MNKTMGTLKKTKKSFVVTLPSKKGKADRPIPLRAQRFRPDEAKDGMEVEVTLDETHQIVMVTIPGAAPTPPPAPKPIQRVHTTRPSKPSFGRPSRGSDRGGSSPGGQSPPIRDLPKAPPEVIGLPFHNPYTFLTFPDQPPRRNPPTPLTADELPQDQSSRFTGVLELTITTKSPLLTCDPHAMVPDAEHKTHRALRIGRDVILPATGVRGALRALLTILTGSGLGHLDEHAYLCQGRDNNLGPAGPMSRPGTPKKPFLAKVEIAGTALRSGTIRLGETRLVSLAALEKVYRAKLPRGHRAPALWAELDPSDKPLAVAESQPSDRAFQLKVSGRPINWNGKREGAFRANERTVELPPKIWAAYSSRNTCGDRPTLRKEDLVWLEPRDPDLTEIKSAADIKSIQWARWGRTGRRLKDQVPRSVWPDYMAGDGQTSPVTDLFGQVSPTRQAEPAPAFAARVRPENLVFFDAVDRLDRNVTLAPLAVPHPGCIAFYRDGADPDSISEGEEFPLRGYKVYRTTLERGSNAPWRYEVQGVYGKQGELLDKKQKLNKTCDLLLEESVGHLRIAFRALTDRELALLLQACAVPWRLGGGKPLGLGLCEVRVVNLIDETGAVLKIPNWVIGPDDNGVFRVDGWQPLVRDLSNRVAMWNMSQEPVAKLRYPRAVGDSNRKHRGGHVWFQRHAEPRKGSRDEGREPGLEPLHIDGELLDKAAKSGIRLDPKHPMIAAQLLPRFDAGNPQRDLLFGYDAIGTFEVRDERKVYSQLEEFSPAKHVTGREESKGSHGKDAAFRRSQKLDRGD